MCGSDPEWGISVSAVITDEQTRGPSRYFTHEHMFHPHGSDTLMIDRVSFAAPLGILGQVVERLVLATSMRKLIEQRNLFLQSIVR